MSKWFPADRYLDARRHAIVVARGLSGRFEVGIEKLSQYGRPGFRAGFVLPRAEYRQGFETRCEVVCASDPLPAPGDGS